ncbi:hypothetical protein J4407_00830 [Candidatus Pacearchaeota archaeon]|nr:hypothetical protein [Candidatus Pacearchaeota archaeon]
MKRGSQVCSFSSRACKRGVLLVVAIFLVFSLIFLISGKIETKSVLLKYTLNKDSVQTKYISISSDEGGEIDLSVNGIEKGVILDHDSIVLEEGEEKQVEVLFDTNSVSEGVYVGNIKLMGNGEEKIIPVIFEVESEDVFFDSNLEIPSRYSNIAPGGTMTLQINVFDLLAGGGLQEGLGTSSVDVEYKVHDIYGNTIISENENFVVDDKILITKTISFPRDIKTDQYVFSATVRYFSSVGTTTGVFTISKSQQSGSGTFNFNGGVSDSTVLILFAAFVFLVLILFFVYIIRDRDKLVLELRELNSQELERHKIFLMEQAKFIGTKKGINKVEIQKEVKNNIQKIKEKQKERVDELKKLKKEGNIEEMKRKVEEWKRKGYNTMLLEYKLKGLSTKEMKEIMNKWKEKYKT